MCDLMLGWKMSEVYVLPDVGVKDVRGVCVTRYWCGRCQRCMCYLMLGWKMSEVHVLPDVGVDNCVPYVGVEDVRGVCVT